MRRTWAELALLYADNITGDITPARLRDGFESTSPHVSTSPPTGGDDETLGFDVGHSWIDTSTTPLSLYVCLDPTEGASMWALLHPDSGGGEWGEIGGDLEDQEDLALALAGKSDVGHGHTLADIADAGTAAAADATAFATSAQGAAADAALPATDPRVPPTPVGQANGRMLAVASDALVFVDAPSGGASTAEDVTYDNAGSGLAAENVQAALDEIVATGGAGGIPPVDGIIVARHGANASLARPTAASVYWQGSVAPSNRELGDFWLVTGAYD